MPNPHDIDNIQRSSNPTARLASGFTLVEILIVLAIVAIIMVATIPSKSGQVNQAYIQETLSLIEPYKPRIAAHYHFTGEFPQDNEEAHIPHPEEIMGNYLASVAVQEGSFHLVLGNKIHDELQGGMISVRPIFVPGAEGAPISWICGYDAPPDGMVVSGENLTDVEKRYLPIKCR